MTDKLFDGLIGLAFGDYNGALFAYVAEKKRADAASADRDQLLIDLEEYRRDVAALTEERDRLQAALVRLRDCDWVITLPDRMDAVREIARKALEGEG